ncbi:multisubunit potassium/proton antiporter PhaG subunit [Roseovarius halotolerans]|uniref:Na(+)/H(+) antiporter subunit G n=1 Tax=Roseovarius halotolerans TaxID=505353 RepID=A0A1X6YJL6_9RHOB|nr:Na+/H+ antiporter subunit G [Roseovarius halotolerans]RKT34485.1 multisubunit potassium/proton antiporter PhaG subunit [Roseovarius halotolerans]SLN22749.1 Na(+)/H(+) antiporter subunit G [Roseovarius halotolerans]
MDLVSELLISFFLVVAGIFGLVGSFGMIKLRDTMQRLHAPTKATTLGVGGVLIGSMLYFLLVKGMFSFHELLITLFLFLTAPITANFIAKTFMQANLHQSDLPGTESEYGWSIYQDPPERSEED